MNTAENTNESEVLVKTIAKAEKILGQDQVTAMLSQSNQELELAIVSASKEVEEVKQELEANPNYQKVKEDKALLESGYREVKKHCNIKVKLAVTLLQSRGK